MSLEAAFTTVTESLDALKKEVAGAGDANKPDLEKRVAELEAQIKALGELDPELAKLVAAHAEKAKEDTGKMPGGGKAPPFGQDDDEDEEGKGKAKKEEGAAASGGASSDEPPKGEPRAKSIDDMINVPGAWPRDMAAITKNADDDYDFGADPWAATK